MEEEQVAVVDASGRVTGSEPRSVIRCENLAHLVVAILVRDSAGRVYVHRRSGTKDVFPDLHDCFVAGCVAAGELPAAAAARELQEELGITGTWVRPIFTQWYGDESTRHLCHVFTTTYDGPIIQQESEIAWGAWLTIEELRTRLADPYWPMVPDGRALITEWLADSAPPRH